MNGCKKCPAYAKCTETYRGSGCAALRYTYGLESDPKLDCTDREKLVELLWAHPCDGKDCKNCERMEPDCDAAALADKLLDNGVTFATDTNDGSKWISVEDRLPTKEDADKVGHVMAIIKGDDFAQIFSWNTVAINPRGFTHWMPLPKPPKED